MKHLHVIRFPRLPALPFATRRPPPPLTPTSTSIQSLPLELILHILSFLRDPGQLKDTWNTIFPHLCLVSRRMNELATAFLYEEAYVRTNIAMVNLARTLKKNPSKGFLIKELISIDDDGQDVRRAYGEEKEMKKVATIDKVLRRTPNLRSLKLMYWSDFEIAEVEKKRLFWRELFASVANATSCQELHLASCAIRAKHLPCLPQIKNVQFVYSYIWDFDPTIFPSVTRLAIYTTPNDWDGLEPGKEGLTPLIWHNLETGTLSELAVGEAVTGRTARKLLHQDLKGGGGLQKLEVTLKLGNGEEPSSLEDQQKSSSQSFPAGFRWQESRIRPINITFRFHLPAVAEVASYVNMSKSLLQYCASDSCRVACCRYILDPRDEKYLKRFRGALNIAVEVAQIECVAVVVEKTVIWRDREILEN